MPIPAKHLAPTGACAARGNRNRQIATVWIPDTDEPMLLTAVSCRRSRRLWLREGYQASPEARGFDRQYLPRARRGYSSRNDASRSLCGASSLSQADCRASAIDAYSGCGVFFVSPGGSSRGRASVCRDSLSSRRPDRIPHLDTQSDEASGPWWSHGPSVRALCTKPTRCRLSSDGYCHFGFSTPRLHVPRVDVRSVQRRFTSDPREPAELEAPPAGPSLMWSARYAGRMQSAVMSVSGFG